MPGDGDLTLLSIIQIEVRLADADGHAEFDQHVQPYFSLAVVEHAEVALADALHDRLENGAVRHIRIRVPKADAIRAAQQLKIVTQIIGHPCREAVAYESA